MLVCWISRRNLNSLSIVYQITPPPSPTISSHSSSSSSLTSHSIELRLPKKKRTVLYPIAEDVTVSNLLQQLTDEHKLDETKNWVLVSDKKELDAKVRVLSQKPASGVYEVVLQ